MACSDYDTDCLDGLVCWYGESSGWFPGCSGTPKAGMEYCVAHPNAIQSVEPDSNGVEPSLMERARMNLCEGDW